MEEQLNELIYRDSRDGSQKKANEHRSRGVVGRRRLLAGVLCVLLLVGITVTGAGRAAELPEQMETEHYADMQAVDIAQTAATQDDGSEAEKAAEAMSRHISAEGATQDAAAVEMTQNVEMAETTKNVETEEAFLAAQDEKEAQTGEVFPANAPDADNENVFASHEELPEADWAENHITEEGEATVFAQTDALENLELFGDDASLVKNPEEMLAESEPVPEGLVKAYNPNMVMELTERELATLLTLVEAEAPAEDIYGKMLVANVVLNRVNDPDMANTVEGVIFEKIGGSVQFSPTAMKTYWNSIVVTDSTREAVERVLSGEDYSQGALYFFAWKKTTGKKAKWFVENTAFLMRYGGHEFYGEK